MVANEPNEGTPVVNGDEGKSVNNDEIFQPMVATLQKHMGRLVEITSQEVDAIGDVILDLSSEICKMKQQVDELVSAVRKSLFDSSAVNDAVPLPAVNDQDAVKYEEPLICLREPTAEDIRNLELKGLQPDGGIGKPQYQCVAKIEGLQESQIKDIERVLEEALGKEALKFCATDCPEKFVEVQFTTEEVMDKGTQIILNNPLELKLSVIEKKKITDTVPVPLENAQVVVKSEASLTDIKEPTEESSKKPQSELQEEAGQQMLKSLCKTLESDIIALVKDHPADYLFMVEAIRPADLTKSDSECFLTFAGVNSAGKLAMGYEALRSDRPSPMPHNTHLQKLFKVFADFMKSSDKPFFDPRKNKGYWHSLMIRSNYLGHCMVVLVAQCERIEDPSRFCEEFQWQVLKRVNREPGKNCDVKSVTLKVVRPEASRSVVWRKLYGEEHLDEEVAGLKLRIYKDSFWCDGGCTQEMCDAVIQELGINLETGVVEMGMATGLICIYLSKHCKLVCSLERVSINVPLAEDHIEMNGLKNIILKQGSAPSVFEFFEGQLKDCESVSAVLTESSSILRSREDLSAVRKSLWIKKVALLMASHGGGSKAFKILCTNDVNTPDPFVLVKAIPFEQPSSVEPVVLFVMERMSVLGDRAEMRPANVGVSVTESSEPEAKKAKLTTEESTDTQLLTTIKVEKEETAMQQEEPAQQQEEDSHQHSKEGRRGTDNGQQSSDRRSSDYSWRATDENRGGDKSRFQDLPDRRSRGTSRVANQDGSTYDRKNTSDFRHRDAFEFKDQDTSRLKDWDSLRYQDKDTSRIQDRDSLRFEDKGISRFRDLDSYNSRRDISNSRHEEWDTLKFQDRGSSSVDRNQDVSVYRDRELSRYDSPMFQSRDSSRYSGRDSLVESRDLSRYPSRDSLIGGRDMSRYSGQDSLERDSMFNSSRESYLRDSRW